MGRKGRPEAPDKVGGLAFYLSLLALAFVSVSNIAAIWQLIPSFAASRLYYVLYSVTAIGLGMGSAFLLIPSYIHVFIHETKHALLSGLVGNSWKEMNVDTETGHFEYSYTKKTAHFNALIALAPYFLPLFTLLGILLGFALFRTNEAALVSTVSFFYGFDLYSNCKDISPYQSDFSSIRGGFTVALVYVIAANIFIASIVIAWTLFSLPGLQRLLIALWDHVSLLITIMR